ncbi:Multidrug resistance-associated protein 1 [Chytriomyces hyalinus]|nr:Multidrug resistance-associated protein 1 [Chytriomyces hyalinus]
MPNTPACSQIRMDPWSFVTASWMTSIIRKGAKQDLEGSDLPKLREVDLAANTSDWTLPILGTNQTSSQTAQKHASMFGSMLAATWPLWLASGILNLVSISGILGIPLVLQQIIDLASAKSVVDNLSGLPPGAWDSDLVTLEQINERVPGFKLMTKSSVKLAFLLLGLKVVSSVTGRLHDTITRRLIFNTRTILMNAVARKSLTISPAMATEFSKGYVLNLVNVDTEAITWALEQFHQLWAIPVQIVVAFSLLASMLGSSVGAGLGALFASLSLLCVAIPMLIVKSVPLMIQASDSRVKLIREVLDGIKLLKIRSMEHEFMAEIGRVRARQIHWLERFLYGIVSFVVIGQLATYLMPVASFSLYAARGNSMSPSIVFPALALFNMLISPLIMFPQVLNYVINASISWNRVFLYLVAPDRKDVGLEPPTSNTAVRIQAASFCYPYSQENELLSSDSIKLSSSANEKKEAVEGKGSGASAFTLRDINLVIPRGQLVLIVGRVGSGKSTLLNAILGQLETVKGKISRNGTVSYCPQQPWIRTGTVEENILFGTAYDETKLKNCISVTSLERDISGMPSGVKTVLGEKGTSISGGQKTRISLARAVYSESDIYLLDDPLSSLDARVARDVLDNCIKTALRGKTVLLATHNHDILKEADHIIFIQNGEIIQGTHQEMMRNLEFADFIVTLDNTKESIAGSNAVADCHSASRNHIMSTEELPSILAIEESEAGNVKWSTYKSYVKATGGFITLAGICASLFFQQACIVLSSMWLTWWTSNNLLNEPRDVRFWTLWYNVLAWICVGFLVCLNLIILNGIVKSTKIFHEKCIEGVLNSPVWWFESQQIGRIMNRFTKDMAAIDQHLLPSIFQLIAGVGAILSVLVILAITAPYLLIGVIPLTVLYLYVLRLYRSTIRQLKRLESTQRSPLFSHIAESLEGVTTISAYNKKEYFGQITSCLLDHSNSPLFFKFGAEIWVVLRLEVLSGFLTFALSLLSTNNSVISAQNLGLALLFTNSLTVLMNMVLQSAANMETEMVSVERLTEYAERLPVEGPYILPSDPSTAEWPSAGCIEFKSVSAFYKSQLNKPVLRDLSVSIKAGEKVCIVGRTGSGKSTMLGVLLRFVDMKGSLTIDGIDIGSVGLRTLRKSMEVIPQDVHLFSKSIRFTLDSSGSFSDEELWAALDAVGMKRYISNMTQKLDTVIDNGGSSMSLGQRQLLFFARILLSRTKIILMDEATSSVDPETEASLRRVIQEKFSRTTLLAVLHRLQTSVLDDFDKVLVMDAGCVVEFDAPRNLLQKEGSVFASLFHAHMSD